MTEPLTMLIVDDTKGYARVLASRMENEGLEILTATSGEEALRILESGKAIDILASDFSMHPGMDGAELVNRSLAIKPELYTIIFTAYTDREYAIKSLRAGVHAFIYKTKSLEDDFRQAIRRAVQRLMMDRFGRQLIGLFSQEQVFDLVFEALRKLNRFGGCVFTVWGQDRSGYKLQRAENLRTGEKVYGRSRADEQSAYRWVMETERSYFPPVFGPTDRELQPYHSSSCSILIVPIKLQNDDRGALGIEHEAEKRLDIDDLRFLNRLATWVSLAMERLTEQNRVRVVGELSRSRSNLLARTVLHELNNPLQTLSIIAQEVAGGALDPDHRETLLQTIGKINQAVNQHLRPLLQERPELSSVDLGEVLEEAIERFYLFDPQRQTTVHSSISPSLPTIRGYRNMLVSALLNLLNNGSEAAGDKGELHVSVQYVRSRNRIELIVRDNGPGVPADLQNRVFDYGYSTRDTDDRGYGLALTKDVVESCGGEIALVPSASKGATFKIGFYPEGPDISEISETSVIPEIPETP